MDIPGGYRVGQCREKLDTLICLLCNVETQPTSSSRFGTDNHMLSLTYVHFSITNVLVFFFFFLSHIILRHWLATHPQTGMSCKTSVS